MRALAYKISTRINLPHTEAVTANFCIISRSPTVSMKNGHFCRKNKFLLEKLHSIPCHTYTPPYLITATKQNRASLAG